MCKCCLIINYDVVHIMTSRREDRRTDGPWLVIHTFHSCLYRHGLSVCSLFHSHTVLTHGVMYVEHAYMALLPNFVTVSSGTIL
jgi:hypothetical protein